MTYLAARSVAISALVGAVAFVITPIAPAVANPAPIHISGTGSDGLLIRPTPDRSQPAVGWMPDGASPDYTCFTYGEPIGGLNVWFQITYNGVGGFYPSYYDDSRYATEAELTASYGVGKCGADAPVASVAPAPSAAPTSVAAGRSAANAVSSAFNGAAAAKWATAHARDTPPADSACTWFVSQALWAGGLATSTTWTSAGHHGGRRRPGSQTAWYTPSFVNYIRATYPRSTYTELNFRANAVPAARPGDVIVYAWDGGASVSKTSSLDHASVVVDIASGQYPEVAEWSISDLGPFGRASSYTKRGCTWSQKSHAWLQSKHPKVQAFLLHINATR
jgi:hypothetical protein